MDYYDKIRSSLWRFKDEKRAIIIGVQWCAEWSNLTYIDKIGSITGGHALCVIGWKGEFLKIQNSVGVNIGDNGIQYIHRNIINLNKGFGAIMFADLPPLLTKEQIINLSENYRKKNLIEWILELLNKILNYMIKNKIEDTNKIEKKEESVKDTENNISDNPRDIKDKDNGQLLWDTPQNVRHSIRVICDEYSLSWMEKDLLCDICKCESGFNPNAKLVNTARSIDRGLFQWNSFYFPEITDEMAFNPEINTRLAVKALKEKKFLTYWKASMKCWNKDGQYDNLISKK